MPSASHACAMWLGLVELMRIHAPAWLECKTIAIAAGLGAINVVCRLRELGYGWNSVALHAAAGGGHLGMVMYLYSTGLHESP